MRLLFMSSSTSLSHLARTLELARFCRHQGSDVSYACGIGSWPMLPRAYGFRPIRLSDVRLEGAKTFGIGSPSSDDLVRSYASEMKVIERVRPDGIISDWRLTASFSAAASGIRCIQVWNANWGLFAGYSSLVDQTLLPRYSSVLSEWRLPFEEFTSRIEGASFAPGDPIFRGDLNLIPDYPLFRNCDTATVDANCFFIGPLVPLPPAIPTHHDTRTRHDITIAFGGHRLPELARVLMDVVSSLGFSCFKLESTAQVEVAEGETFSFFPERLKVGKIVITHGGIGSIYQSLFVGKPLLVIPQHLEQFDNGSRVKDLNVGDLLNVNDKPKLRRAIKSLVDDDVSRLAAINLGTLMRRMDPLSLAHQIISNFLR